MANNNVTRPEDSASNVAHSSAIAIAIVFCFFAIAYARSLTFVYIEGDDATSIAYHALGRSRELQPPYSPYQSMMDAILQLLPPNEHLLRTCAMLITSLAAPVVVVLLVFLAYDMMPGLLRMPRWMAALIAVLIIPEFAYLGLVYTPALVALAALLGSHLALRRSFERVEAGAIAALRTPKFLFSIALFGAGAACRWDTLAYAAIIVGDICLVSRTSYGSVPSKLSNRLRLAVLWVASAMLAWIMIVRLYGYGLEFIWRTLRASGPVEHYPGLLVMLSTLQTLTTPALAVSAIVGMFILFRQKHPFIILVMLGIAVTGRFLPFGVPKWLLVAVPGIVVCALVGYSTMWNSAADGCKGYCVRGALLIAVLIPWFLGLQGFRGDSAYGPGFQVQPFDRPFTSKSGFKAVFGPGVLVPTSEGPRPVGGHAWVLLGDQWRKTATQNIDELSSAIQEAMRRNIPLLQDQGQGFAVSMLLGMGLKTRDPWNRMLSPSFLIERRFASADGKMTLRLFRLAKRDDLFTSGGVRRIEKLAGTDNVATFAYTSTLRRCYKQAPDALKKVGRGTEAALINLDQLRIQFDTPP